MRNIVFLNFDSFTKEKTKFFNIVNKTLSKKNLNLIILSDEEIKGAKFQLNKLNYKKYVVNGNLRQIKKILKIKKKNEKEWENILKLYYKRENLNFIRNKINSLITNYLYFLIKNKPSLAIIWTEYHPFCEIFKLMCQHFKINFLIAERGLLNETIVIEKNGIYGKSYITDKRNIQFKKVNHFKKFIKVYDKLRDKWSKKRDKYFNPKDIYRDKKTIFFAGTNEIWHGLYPYKNSQTSPLYNSHFQLLKDLSKIKMKYENLEIIFKPHPKDRIFNLYQNFIPKNITILKETNAIDLIKKSDLFITIASSLICDAMFYNKPSLIVGKFEISNKNICHEVKKKSDLSKFIKLFYKNKLPKKNPDKWKFFINFILDEYLYNVSKYKFGKLNENDLVNKLLKYNKLNTNKKKFKVIEKELKNIKLNTYFKIAIKDNIKKLFSIIS